MQGMGLSGLSAVVGMGPRDKIVTICSILVLDLDTNIARKQSTIDSVC